MPKRVDRSNPVEAPRPLTKVPVGAPSWITPELIENTIRVWQPFYSDQLIPEDALAIIKGVAGIVEVMSSGADHETVRSPSTGQQP
jgi:hypothetical protein